MNRAKLLSVVGGALTVTYILWSLSEIHLLHESRELWISKYKELLPHVPLEVKRQLLTDLEFEALTKEL